MLNAQCATQSQSILEASSASHNPVSRSSLRRLPLFIDLTETPTIVHPPHPPLLIAPSKQQHECHSQEYDHKNARDTRSSVYSKFVRQLDSNERIQCATSACAISRVAQAVNNLPETNFRNVAVTSPVTYGDAATMKKGLPNGRP